MTRRGWLVACGALVGGKQHVWATASLAPLEVDGFRRMVATHRGRILLVDFWATWCAPCREELPKLVDLYTAQKSKGLDLVTISCDEPEQEAAAAQVLRAQRAPEPAYIRQAASDDSFINAINSKWSGALPALFLFDRTGRQIQSFVGETDMKLLEKTIDKAISS
jgi:thiol-disulfide isomerase/thioredoxin